VLSEAFIVLRGRETSAQISWVINVPGGGLSKGVDIGQPHLKSFDFKSGCKARVVQQLLSVPCGAAFRVSVLSVVEGE
jgi:hypothetical protein